MYRVFVFGLPLSPKPTMEHIQRFFKNINCVKIEPIPGIRGQICAFFNSPQEAIDAVQNYNGNFYLPNPGEPMNARRVVVCAGSEQVNCKIVREKLIPEEPTKEELKDNVRMKAVGGEWPRSNDMGIVNHKRARHRRYKPPGYPKPRHG